MAVGSTFAGQDLADLPHAVAIAIIGELPVSRLWNAVPVFPTMSKTWQRPLEADGL